MNEEQEGTKPENPFAFPSRGDANNAGMTLRDYFAGQALVGLASYHGVHAGAEDAYFIADAMLRARGEGQ